MACCDGVVRFRTSTWPQPGEQRFDAFGGLLKGVDDGSSTTGSWTGLGFIVGTANLNFLAVSFLLLVELVEFGFVPCLDFKILLQFCIKGIDGTAVTFNPIFALIELDADLGRFVRGISEPDQGGDGLDLFDPKAINLFLAICNPSSKPGVVFVPACSLREVL